ncbi:MAG: radical SAM protein [Promethearchaeota archaeon]
MNYKRELLIEICRKCYLNCLFCSSDSSDQIQCKIDIKAFKKVIKDSNKLDIKTVQISGGEPFTHPKFLKFIDILKNHNKKIEIYTSGNIKINNSLSPLPKKLLMNLRNKKVNIMLRFNLQSHKEKIHNFLTGERSYNNTITSIKNTNEVGLACEIHLIPLKQNYKTIEKSIDFFKQLNVSKVKILKFLNHGRGALNNNILKLSSYEEQILFKSFKKLKKNYKNFVEIGAAFNYLNINYNFCNNACLIGKKITITPNLKVYPCVSTKNLDYFNFQIKRNNMLLNIIKSKYYLNSVRSFSEQKHSFSCSICPSQRYYNKNKIKKIIFKKKDDKKQKNEIKQLKQLIIFENL